MHGKVFSIEEFSVYDGPGIRTTVFLKGCPLRCSWCHNPEGQNASAEIIRSPNGCIRCNACIKNAVTKDGVVSFTKKSIESCPMNLLRICGDDFESDVLCKKLMKNEMILSNGGGVTFSGGEPLMQSEFVFECLNKLKGKLHTAIQTCGYCEEKSFLKSIELADYFLFDLKLADDTLHKRYTGVSNEIILNNFSHLTESNKEFTVRIPLIPGVTDTNENTAALAKTIKSKNVNYVELLPYNKMAGGKYKMLGRKYQPGFDERAQVNIHNDIFENYGIKIKVL